VRFARPSFLPFCALVLLAGVAVGCGSDGSGSGYGSRDSTDKPATARATTPEAPPGATARSCEGATAGIGGLRVTGIGCSAGRDVVAAWVGEPSCTAPVDASRFSCAVGDNYHCIGADAERGIAVSCARPGASASFIAAARG
jgi:hypothetical protein